MPVHKTEIIQFQIQGNHPPLTLSERLHSYGLSSMICGPHDRRLPSVDRIWQRMRFVPNAQFSTRSDKVNEIVNGSLKILSLTIAHSVDSFLKIGMSSVPTH